MADHSSNLAPLLASWGVDYDPAKVIGDLERGLEVRTSMQSPPIRHIGILGLSHDDMNQKDVVSASLDKVNLATAAHSPRGPGPRPPSSLCCEFHQRGADSGATFQRPHRSLDSARRIQSHGRSLRPGPPASRGRWNPHFPMGRRRIKKPPPVRPVAHLAKSAAPANIVIIADTDLLMDYMWVQTREVFDRASRRRSPTTAIWWPTFSTI